MGGDPGGSTGGTCVNDFYEPNNNVASATSTFMSAFITADDDLTLCGDDDYYNFEVCAGGSLRVTVTFDSFNADIDLELTLEGDTSPITDSAGVSDTELVTYSSIGDQAQVLTLRVFVYGGSASSDIGYTMNVDLTGCP